MSNDDINARRREQVKLNMLTVAAVAGWYIDTYLDKRPCRDSALSGAAYVNELLIGHLERFRQVCRMERPIFMKLCNVIRSKNLLCDTRDITLEEQLIMFLFTIGHNAVNRQVQERFQHSDVIIACCTLHNFIHSHSNGEDWIYEEYDLQYENQFSEQEDINEPDDDYKHGWATSRGQ
ncbi:putative nuclease HARBI1 [Cinnamomum micranthum f. kanehirae]|uniref:Putative nuclease HARBI1 n=1 Tax=Cinnamomum micranthum f. kanehirae TaxID=337451 RepID=A0A443NFL2_9MAGN|nr:putative nuclease HARBI1 [Cinnamomum micranthum f. kanehirae]